MTCKLDINFHEYQKGIDVQDMTNEERWDAFISDLKVYIEEHHHGANKHTDLYNRTRYYRRKMKEGSLPDDKARVLEEVLSLRHLDEHTGGRKKRNAELQI